MKGYAAGVLLSDKESPFEKALTPVQCLHYCLTRPAAASVMVGVANIKQAARKKTIVKFLQMLRKKHLADIVCTVGIVLHVLKR